MGLVDGGGRAPDRGDRSAPAINRAVAGGATAPSWAFLVVLRAVLAAPVDDVPRAPTALTTQLTAGRSSAGRASTDPTVSRGGWRRGDTSLLLRRSRAGGAQARSFVFVTRIW